MMRYKCVVSYCGKNYAGWQRQKDAASVQGEIEKVLQKITQKEVLIHGSGRTDAGVNAKGQVFHFDSDLEMTPYKWQGAINGFLPDDIHIVSMEEVNDLFHARYCVKAKRYDYCINLGPYDVFTRETAYQYGHVLDIEKMKLGASYFIGTHDFSSFCANSKIQTEDQERTIYAIDFIVQDNMLRISFYGRGFLRYMVRMMVGQLLEVGRGKISPEQIQTILNAKSKTVVRKTAPAQGLTLVEVEYFQLFALSDKAMIREILPEDHLNSTNKPDLVIVNRQKGYLLGKVYREENSNLVSIIAQSEKYVQTIQELLPQFSKELQAMYPNIQLREITVCQNNQSFKSI